MSPQIAQLLTASLLAWLFVRDLRRRVGVSHASWIAFVWIFTYASRPVSMWFGHGGVQTPDGYLEGNPIERSVSLILIVAASAVLLRRRVSWSCLLQQNSWLFVFFGYCLLSVLWSDYPFVSFKRWVKDFGNVLIVLLLLTERSPSEAVKAVFVRCAYLLVTLSFLFVRYFPDMGRVYGGWNQNDLMLVGVATHKNTLGALLLVSVAFLAWDLLSRNREAPAERYGWADRAIVLAMAAWLLSVANSATSLVCSLLATGVLLITGMKVVKRRMRLAEIYIVLSVGMWFLLDYAFSIREFVILSLGRDLTLTTRTGAWDFVLSQVDNPVLGAGFKSFWSGERMVRLWQELPGIVQAHSGYVETYLNGGYLGLFFLAAAMFAGFRQIKRDLVAGIEFARLRLVFWIVALVYNYSEAAFNQLSLLWVVTLISIMEMPTPVPEQKTVVAPRRWSESQPRLRPAAAGYTARWSRSGAYRKRHSRDNVVVR